MTVALHNKLKLEMLGVSHYFDFEGHSIEVLKSINLSVHQSEFVALIGPSGCGKTTCLRIASGLQLPTAGQVLLDGTSPNLLLEEGKIGFMFQQPTLLRWRTVRENVLLPVELLKTRAQSKSTKEWQDRADKLLHLVGLTGFENMYPHQLSGGMQSRVSLARTLCCEPEVLFMDEPFGHLDELTRAHLNFELLSLHAKYSPTIIFVTHSVNEAVTLADRVIVMSKLPGQILDEITIELPRPRSLNDADSLEYYDHVRSIRKILLKEIDREAQEGRNHR